MGERLREWVGLKAGDRAIGAKINETDMRIGAGVSLLVAVLEALIIASMLADPAQSVPAGYDPQAWAVRHIIAYCLLLAASVALFICSLLYLKGKVRSRWTPRVAVYVFEVVALVFGMYISSFDYAEGRLILTFSTMVVMCSCLFIVLPVVTFVTNTVVFAVFYWVIDATAGAGPGVGFNLFCFYLITLVASVARYNEKRLSVQAQLEVVGQSMHDALTGLQNRRSLNERFERVEPGGVALVMLDVDDFKFFNDAYGHAVGDSVLRQFSAALMKVFSKGACYRSGGDEFLVLERGLSQADLQTRLHELHLIVKDIKAGGESLFVSSSVGAVTGSVETSEDLQNMLRIADIAMYEAKRQGKNRIAFKTYDSNSPDKGTGQTPRMLAYKIEETDLLTGLPNYTHFRNRAARVLENPSGFEGGVALVYFDIENFKAFNYEYGYEGGDAFLCSLADVLRDVFKGQLVARFGEDRFVVLTDRNGVEERVIDAHERAHSYQRDIPLELKAGICLPKGEEDVSVIYDRAKLACDSIKGEFDRVFRIYDDALSQQTQRRNHIVNTLDEAIGQGWIKVYYQPVMRAQTCRMCGMEALARWVDPKLGMIGPDEFVDVLEQHHLVDKLDAYILRSVCADYRRVLSAHMEPVPVSVNLSRLDFELCDVFDMVEGTLAEYKVPRSMVHLEVTETALADNSELVKGQIVRFRKAGYQVWMDDFGSGYSSLNLLKEFDFDLLKIDMLFLRGLEEHRESRVIISSIVDMAKQLGIQTLAEGVETRDQLEFLREIGCEKLQGYLFSKPRPLHEVLDLVSEGKIVVESMESRGYYAATGKVNIIGRSPSEGDGDDGESEGMLPLAILEHRDGTFRYLGANESYIALMTRLGVGSLEDAEARFNGGFLKPVATFTEICRRVKHEGGTLTQDHITGGVHCSTRVSYIASEGDVADAFLIRTISDTDFSKSEEEQTLRDALRFLFSVYARVDIIAEDNGLARNIYLNSGQYRGIFMGDDAARSLADYARDNVHPDDRARFMDYYDMGTALKRLEARGLSHLSAFFRTRAAGGGFAWQFYMLIPVQKGGRGYWLSCVRDIDPGAVRFLPEAGGIAEEAALWESILTVDDVGIFWKDDHLRFEGANRAFMDFYGIENTDEFVGKTEEEMPWNIRGGDAPAEERRVLDTGEPVSGAHADVLAQGAAHRVVVDKVPIVEEGRRVGIVGMFRSVDQRDADSGRIFSFVTAIAHYVRAYREHGIDFGFTCVRIRGLDEYVELYGDSFADDAMARLVEAAYKATGNRGIVTRSGRLGFTVVMQVKDRDEIVQLNDLYSRAFGTIGCIDGVPMKLKLECGSCLFSETEDIDEMVLLAEKRARLVDDTDANDVPRNNGGE